MGCSCVSAVLSELTYLSKQQPRSSSFGPPGLLPGLVQCLYTTQHTYYYLDHITLIRLKRTRSGHAGTLLVASSQLEGSSFGHSVVAITSHGPQGTTGVVLSRPMGGYQLLGPGELLGQASWATPTVRHFHGGPVGQRGELPTYQTQDCCAIRICLTCQRSIWRFKGCNGAHAVRMGLCWHSEGALLMGHSHGSRFDTSRAACIDPPLCEQLCMDRLVVAVQVHLCRQNVTSHSSIPLSMQGWQRRMMSASRCCTAFKCLEPGLSSRQTPLQMALR